MIPHPDPIIQNSCSADPLWGLNASNVNNPILKPQDPESYARSTVRLSPRKVPPHFSIQRTLLHLAKQHCPLQRTKPKPARDTCFPSRQADYMCFNSDSLLTPVETSRFSQSGVRASGPKAGAERPPRRAKAVAIFLFYCCHQATVVKRSVTLLSTAPRPSGREVG